MFLFVESNDPFSISLLLDTTASPRHQGCGYALENQNLNGDAPSGFPGLKVMLLKSEVESDRPLAWRCLAFTTSAKKLHVWL